MANLRQPTDYTYTFSGAGEVTVPTMGKHVYILEASGDVFIRLDSTGTELKRQIKSHVATSGFKNVKIRSAVAQTVRVCISDEPQNEGVDNVAVTASATVEVADSVNAPLDVTCDNTVKVLIAGNVDRKSVEIGVKDDASNGVRVGPSGVTSGRGSYIAPGTSKIFYNTAALYGTRDGGSNVDVYIFEERKT